MCQRYGIQYDIVPIKDIYDTFVNTLNPIFDDFNEFKRYQTAPALRVSSKAFGMGRRMLIVGKYLS